MSFLRNRTVIGVFCILLSVLICFGLTPLFNRAVSQKVEIVRVTQPIRAGEQITDDMVQLVQVGGYNLPDNVLHEKGNAVGKYATADLAVGDYIINTKLSDVPAADNAYLYDLDGSQQAISVTIRSFANNIEAIKRYFCSEYAVKLIAEQTGMDYETLIGGEYKILLEPIAYYKYEGVMIATTATEAAMYDEVVSGHLRTWMGSLTHKNLPLSMFLETADLGYPAWSGSTTQHATNSAIKSSLGLGIVRFEEQPEEPTITTYDYEYRTNTEVITAVEVSGGQSDPDNPVTVRFNILGTTYTVSNVYYPDGDSQLAWVRWTTPDTPQDVTITVSVSGPGSAQGTIQCKIVDLDENPPPNPVADDRNDSFSPSAVPSRAEKTSAQWSIWRPWWYAYWVWHSTGKDSGYWCDHGWWEFDLDRYSASLSASMTITPDTMNPTASGTTMKSGYGINEVVTARVSSSQRSATTALQNAVSYFPEFNYDSFWRLLDRVSISSSSSRLEFQTNEYSTYNRRTHFTPIWYPDGAYTVNTWVIDCWTPVGMLSVNLSDTLTISGNLWDDWHIAPMR